MQLPDTVTLAQAAGLLPQLEAAIDSAASAGTGRFVLDASRLASFDTSALALVLQARRGAQARGLAFALHALPAQLRELAALYGVAELMAAPEPSAPSSPASAAPSSSPSSTVARSVAT
jgi:phospholipid transport system transporter-binding protein